MPKNRRFTRYSYSSIDTSSVEIQSPHLAFEEAINISVKKDDGSQVKPNQKELTTLSNNKAVMNQLFYYLYEAKDSEFDDKHSEFDDFIGSFVHLGTSLSTTTFLIEKGKDNAVILTRTTTKSVVNALVAGPLNPEITLIDQNRNFYSKSIRIHISPVNVSEGPSSQVNLKKQTIEIVNLEVLDGQKAENIKQLGGEKQCVEKINVLKNKKMVAARFSGIEKKHVWVHETDAKGITHEKAAADLSNLETQQILYVYACNAVESYANKHNANKHNANKHNANKHKFFPDSKYLQDIKQLFNLFGFDKNKFLTAIAVLGDRDQEEIRQLFKIFNPTQLIEIHRAIERWGDVNNVQHCTLARNVCLLIPDYDPVASDVILTIKNIKKYLFPDYQIVKNLFFKSKARTVSDK